MELINTIIEEVSKYINVNSYTVFKSGLTKYLIEGTGFIGIEILGNINDVLDNYGYIAEVILNNDSVKLLINKKNYKSE